MDVPPGCACATEGWSGTAVTESQWGSVSLWRASCSGAARFGTGSARLLRIFSTFLLSLVLLKAPFCSIDKPAVNEITVGLGCMSNGLALCAVVG